MKTPRRGIVFEVSMEEKAGILYMSLEDKEKQSSVVCLSSDTGEQTLRTKSLISKVYSVEESSKMLGKFM
jgi:hypothetical protein